MRRSRDGVEKGEHESDYRALSGIPLTSLRQLVVVAQVLNFRHAANVLGVAQSSVSTRIKALEEDLGVMLFERRHRGVRLTEAGRRFIAEVLVGIEHLDHAMRTVGAISSGAEGNIAIGLHCPIASCFLAELRRSFRTTYPKVEQVITEGRTSDVISLVRDGKLDIAFVVGPADAPDCHSRVIWSEPFVIAVPVNHRLATAESCRWLDLAPETFLVRQGGAGPQLLNHITRRIAEREKPPSIRRFDVGRDTLMHMVADGEGITLTTEAATHVPFPGVVFRSISDETERARFSAVWSPHNRSTALKNLLDLAAEIGRSA